MTTEQQSESKTAPGAPGPEDAGRGSEQIGPPRRKNLAAYLGILFVALGLVLTAAVLERLVLPEGTLVGTSRRAVAWGCCRILLIGLGTYLLIRRPPVTTVHLCAFALLGALSAILGALFLQFVFTPPPILCGWRSFAPVVEQNELGFRGHRIDYSTNDYVVVLLGDSHVEAMALPLASMPEQRLESHLNASGRRVRVFSLGAGGYGQDQQLLALQEYFRKYRADLVLLWQTPGNDVWNNLFKTHMFNRNPKPTFWLDSGRLLGPSESLGQPLANSPIVVAALWQRVFALPRRDKEWELRLPEPYSPLNHYEGPVNREWQQRWDADQGRMRAENLATEKSHMAVTLAPRSKRTQYGLDLTRALMQRLQEVIASNNGALVVFQAEVPAFESEDDEMFVLNGKYYRVSRRQFQANWDYVNRGFETEIVPVTVKDWRVSPEDGHLNNRATDQVMSDLAQRLQRRVRDKTHQALIN